MKKKLLIVAILLIALALFTRHYSLIEKNDPLPEDVQAFLNGLTGTAHAAEDEQSYICLLYTSTSMLVVSEYPLLSARRRSASVR